MPEWWDFFVSTLGSFSGSNLAVFGQNIAHSGCSGRICLDFWYDVLVCIADGEKAGIVNWPLNRSSGWI
jgi:hypothetical protein